MNFAGDTIVALSTPPGLGALGIIRMSGPQSFDIAGKMAGKRDFHKEASHTLHFARIQEKGKVIDEVVFALFKNPNSFTGEDIVEITCHGSPYILQKTLALANKLGARQALPGEFTQRAFLNGKMDLSQAEAVADLIHAESEASHKTAMHQMRGGFSKELEILRQQLIRFVALLELELDFSDEDVEFADRSALRKLVKALKSKTHSLLRSFESGNAIKNGVRVAIIGRPNAGKSTLLNALLNEERAIVSDIAGTTRDSIEETLNINGVIFRLIDTAGIREHSSDVIENIGMERSRKNAEHADIILHLQDMTDPEPEPIPWLEQYTGKTLDVYTKFDLYYAQWEAKGILIDPDLSKNPIAIKWDNFGVEQLKKVMFEKAIGESLSKEDTIVTNIRHQQALQQMAESLDAIENGLARGLSGDLLTVDTRRCLYYLGTITGQVEIDRDVLGAIFTEFCIGK